MRQIGTIADEAHARRLVDYLLTLEITSRLVKTPEGWAVWVHHEDRVPRATEEFRAFLQNPDEARYRDASIHAREIRKQAERLEKEHIRNTRDIREEAWGRPTMRRCPLTLGLIATSVALSLLANFGANQRVVYPLLFSSVDPTLVVNESGELVGNIQLRFDPLADLARGQIWRPITPIFLHGDLLHLAFNMYWLIYLGGMIEIRRGSRKLATIVLISAILSNLGQFVYTGSPFFYGMSGVVLALFGYVWMKGLYEPEEGLGLSQTTVFIMILYVGYTTLFGLRGVAIATAAHLVGLAVGILLGVGPHLVGSRGEE